MGIGNSVQKHQWLPYAENDFVFAVIGEELGFVGAIALIALFAALVIQGIFIALRAPDLYGTLLGIGIVSQVAWQVFLHIGVGTALLPNTGISLPFFSYGGTSLLLLLGEMGVLLSISRAGQRAGGTHGRTAPRRDRPYAPPHPLPQRYGVRPCCRGRRPRRPVSLPLQGRWSSASDDQWALPSCC